MDWSPLLISLQTAVVTMGLVLLLGLATAYFVWRQPYAWLRLGADSVLTLPLVLPPTVAGFFLLWLFGRQGLFGRPLEAMGLSFAFTWLGTVLAATVIAFPLMYRAARGAFEQVNKELLQAGRTLGLSEGRIFWQVLLPNALPGLITGSILAFARALGEFGATIMLAGNIAGETRTLPLAVYSAVMNGSMEEAGAYVILIVALCMVMVAGLNYYQYRRSHDFTG